VPFRLLCLRYDASRSPSDWVFVKQAMISAASFLGCALIFTGCTAFETTGSKSKADQSISESPAQPSASPEPVDPRMVVENCSALSYAEGEKVIKGQIKEFNLGRFKKAREYTSVEFREAVTLKDFRSIIKNDYPFLLNSPKVSFNGCIERNEVLYLQVALTVEKVTVLTYRLVRDIESLGIDAATITARSVNAEV
jgi:hypothetical protein